MLGSAEQWFELETLKRAKVRPLPCSAHKLFRTSECHVFVTRPTLVPFYIPISRNHHLPPTIIKSILLVALLNPNIPQTKLIHENPIFNLFETIAIAYLAISILRNRSIQRTEGGHLPSIKWLSLNGSQARLDRLAEHS